MISHFTFNFRHFIIKEVGVTIVKKIIPNTIGDTKFPSKIPNLNQALFKIVNNGEFNKPKIKKIIETTRDQILILPPCNNGKNETSKKNIKKTIPKFLFDPIFILSVFKFYISRGCLIMSSFLIPAF